MSTFNINTPKKGWETRWIKEAFGLMVRTPEIIIVMLGVCFAIGYIEGKLMGNDVGPILSDLIILCVMTTIIAAPSLGWFFFHLGKHEGFTAGGFKDYKVSLRAVFEMCGIIIVTMLILSLFTEQGSERTNEHFTINQIMKMGSSTFMMALAACRPSMIMHVCAGMLPGMAYDERSTIASKASLKLYQTHFTIFMGVAILMGINMIASGLAVLALDVFFLYWLYVACREIIGGITGNRETSKARSGVLSAA